MSRMVLQAVASGVSLGVIYVGVGAGLSLILATGRLINLAYGEFVLVGGYILFVLCQGLGWAWPAALALTLLGSMLRPLVRRLPRREVDGLALTHGAALVLQSLLLQGATATYRVMPGGAIAAGGGGSSS